MSVEPVYGPEDEVTFEMEDGDTIDLRLLLPDGSSVRLTWPTDDPDAVGAEIEGVELNVEGLRVIPRRPRP